MSDFPETVNMAEWKTEKEHDAYLDKCIEETAIGNMEGFRNLYVALWIIHSLSLLIGIWRHVRISFQMRIKKYLILVWKVF